MHLVEKHIISKTHRYFKEVDNLAFRSKNLYNAALYTVRQEYIANKQYLNHHTIRKIFKQHNQPDFRALPAKVSWKVLTQVHQAFLSFFALLKLKQANKYDKRIKLPGYFKNKLDGRNLLTFDNQAILPKENGFQLSGTNITISTKLQCEYKVPTKSEQNKRREDKLAGIKRDKQKLLGVKEIRLVPHLSQDRYAVEVVYEVSDKLLLADNGKYASIDLGVMVLAATIFNQGDRPLLVSGRPILDTNAFWQKETAALKSIIAKGGKVKEEYASSNRIRRMNRKRQNKVNDYLHRITTYLANQIASKEISKVFVGHNKEWKQEVNIGKQNNQKLCLIPHTQFIQMLKYKLQLFGIELIETTEEYTSKCSLVDLETIEKHEEYVGSRNGKLFTAANGKKFHADVCGAGNIMRKATSERSLKIPFKSMKEAEDAAVRPMRVNKIALINPKRVLLS